MRRFRAFVIAVALAVALTGCMPGQKSTKPENPSTPPASKPQTLSIVYNNFGTLDPQVVAYGMWFDATALLEGLVVADEPGNGVLRGVAEKWDTSPDKKVYTFHISKDAKWSNGDPVTAQDFEWTYKRMLTPKEAGAGVTTGANSYLNTIGILGAVDYLSGKLKEWEKVGIKAMDPQTLQITLGATNPDFLLQMTHPSMLPLHPATVQKFPQDYSKPENWVGNGPFVVKEWVMNTSMKLVPNEKYWDRSKVFLSEVNVKLSDESLPAVTYESGELDLYAVPTADLPRFKSDATLSKELKSIPARSVAYLALMRSKNPVLEDVRVRKALSLAMDRETIAKVDPASQPGGFLVPPVVPSYDKSLQQKYDVAEAKKLLAEAGYPDGKGFPELKIFRGGTVGTTEQALADTWQKNLGIKVKNDGVESGVYVQKRQAVQEADYVGYYFGTFSTNPTWQSWGALLWGPEFSKQFSMKAGDWEEYLKIQADKALSPADKTAKLNSLLNQKASPETLEYEKTVVAALAETDTAKQIDLFKKAAKIREETYLFLPIVYIDSIWAAKPTVKGLNLHTGGRPYYLKGVSNPK